MQNTSKTFISGRLNENQSALKQLFSSSRNPDLKFRSFSAETRAAFLCYIDGLCDTMQIEDFILRPAAFAKPLPDTDDAAESFAKESLLVSDYSMRFSIEELAQDVLLGKCVVLIDHCTSAISIDLRKFDKRPVGRTISENVVLGPQEGFTESLRTNLTLLRRTLRSSALICESVSIGTKLPTSFSIVYLEDRVNAAALEQIRERIRRIDAEYVPGVGTLEQLIEDHPYSLFPQMLKTERPDRTASCISEGQIAILSDNSPYALLAPITIFHLLHASDDSFMRWQYGCFIRIVRFLGLLVSLYLPALYTAISMYHTHILPTSLFTSIAETRASVPFPILIEVFIMEISFFLINEAGTRIPSQIGSALGIVGALILGQAAVAASIISPIMIIIVALTGLGNYTIPNYSTGIAVQLLRIVHVLSGALLGLYGIALISALTYAYLCSMSSFGVTFFSPAAPWKPHKADLILRLPIADRLKKSRKEPK